jgi:pimeloyl-ACP methyl ester carboxylesterase
VNERFQDVGGGITLCYERFGDPDAPPLVLVMGLGMQMIGWPDELCEEIAARGFHVVRFDNRDAGRSTHLRAVPPPTTWRILTRRFAPGQYTLSDMAADTVGLLRALGLAPAHVVGASLGGMAAQMVAAEHPDAVRSLTSMMANTGHRLKGQPKLRVYPWLLRPAPATREGYAERYADIFTAIGSPAYPPDRARLRADGERAFERGIDPRGTGRQLGAILASGNRARALRTIRTPTLVVHGTADPLVQPSGGRQTAKLIPGARLLMLEGMGHDLPPALWPQLVDAVVAHAEAADAAEAAA